MAFSKQETLKEYQRRYYLENKLKLDARSKEYWKQHRDELLPLVRARGRQWRQGIKRETLLCYGKGKLACVQCGFNDMRALTLDHINDGGPKHMRNIRNPGGVYFYSFLKQRGFPLGYQTLCANCQMIKQYERQGKTLL